MADSQEYRRKFLVGNLVFLGVLLCILFALFLLQDLLGSAKMDLTSDGIYTISPRTKEILSNLKDEVTINYYVSDELPGQLKTLRRDTKDMFDAFREISKGKIHYNLIDPEAVALEQAEAKVKEYEKAKAEGKTPEEPEPPQSIQQIFMGRPKQNADEIRNQREQVAAKMAAQSQRNKDDVVRELLLDDFKKQHLAKLEQEGVGSFPFSERDASSVRQGKVYSSIQIKYLAKEPEVIPVHYQIESLEYEIAQRIKKLTTIEKPVVAFFDARKPPAPPPNPMNPTPPPESEYEGIIGYLGELFDLRQTDLKENDAIDDLASRVKEDRFRKETEDLDEAEKKDREAKQDKTVKPEELRSYIKCLVVAQPDRLEPRQVYEISRAASLGIPTIFLVSRFSMDASETGVRQGLPLNMISPSVEDMFRKWGVEIGQEVLASNECGTLSLPTNVGGRLQVMMQRELPVCLASPQESLDPSSALTNRIPAIVFPTTTGLKVVSDTVDKAGLKADILARSPPETWSVKINPFEQSDPFRRNAGMGARVANYQEQLVLRKRPEEFRDWIDPMPLAVYLKGKLPFAYQGETIPDWKKEEKKANADPHAGIPGFDPSMLEGDKDLALNATDPQDAKPADGAAAAPAASQPAATPAAQAPAAQTPPTPAPTTPPTPGASPAAPATPVPPAEGGAQAGAKPAEAAPPAPKPKADVQLQEGSVTVLGSVDMLKNEFLRQGREYQVNAEFFRNVVENYALGNELIEIRRKQLTERHFKPNSDKLAFSIQWGNTVLVPLLIGLAGLVYFLVRRADAVAYERKWIQKHTN